MMKKKLRLKQIDFAIVFIFILLAAISIVSISSATYTGDQVFYGKQIIWYLVGFLCMFCVLLFDYKILTQGRVLLLLYGFGILLNLLVMVPGIGEKVNGAQLWIRIGDFSIQPSELMKIFVILILAKIIAQKKGEPWQDLHTLGKILLIAGVPFIIILLQPDLGTALILLAIIASMLLVGGLDRKWLVGGFALVVLVVGAVLLLYISDSPLLHVLLADHQIERIQIFLDPASDPSGAGYQATQAKIAIGSGMLWGKGFHQGTQAQGNWIPEPHNDFIFAVIAEEFGFVGSSVLLLCYLFLLYRLIKIALSANNLFGVYIVSGVIGMFAFQIFQNVGMAIGLMPITGIPLPFISYGGTSIVTQLVAVGLALNVGMHAKKEQLQFTIY
ncbi:MAG: rod shape-determining protein RodA [Thermoactinomyces sp.]